MREIVLGAMPQGATPQTHIASGPWCFTGQEELFPDWDSEKGFPLPPDPFLYSASDNGLTSINATARAANGSALNFIEIFGQELNAKYSSNYSKKFWTMALGPWLLLCTHMLAERQKRVETLISLYGDEPLLVSLFSDSNMFSFDSLLDFMVHGVQNREFNHYVFSRIIEKMAPPTWTLRVLSKNPLQRPSFVAPTTILSFFDYAKVKIKKKLTAFLRDLPFPLQKGFSLWQVLLFSSAVWSNRNTANNSSDFTVYCSTPFEWHFDVMKIIRLCLPKNISQIEKLPSIPNSEKRLRGMTSAISQDDDYRLQLAAWIEGGGKLFSVQHGANYGNLQCMGGSIFEYAQHAFISWGWQRHEGYSCQAIPLPHPTLYSLNNKKKRHFNEEALLIGTEMSVYNYRLKSRPLAAAQVEYRKAKVAFFTSLPKNILSAFHYRPYFATENGLNDASYVQHHLPTMRVCTGDLSERMQKAKLIVIDHYGTTLHLSLASNIPTIVFWDKSKWMMDSYSAQFFEGLHEAGILFYTPEEAARQIATIWDNVEEWWDSKQIAKQKWVDSYALSSLKQGKGYISTWFSALRKM